LEERSDLSANGYTAAALANGDCIVTIRHDGRKKIVVEGDDPQEVADDTKFQMTGDWKTFQDDAALGGSFQAATQKGATMTFPFNGNQVRLIGHVWPNGGWADAYIDGVKEPTVVECWNPSRRHRQPIFLKKGLTNGPHELKIVVRGEKNPLSGGTHIAVDSAQFSAATGDAGDGAGGGPREAQRLIFGYTGRDDFIDSNGNPWRPGTEFITRSGFGVDTVARSWWIARRSMYIGGTTNEEIYRYGVHAPEFWVNLTVAPGAYLVRLHWADTPETAWVEREGDWKAVSRPTSVAINGQSVIEKLNVRDQVGTFKAFVREFPTMAENGTIEVRFQSTPGHDAMIQALEVIPVEADGAADAK
jgi:hypothetical protein